MKYFKNDKGNIYGFEVDGSQDVFIPEDLIRLTPEEEERHLNPGNFLTGDQKRLLIPPLTRRQFRLVLALNKYDLVEIENMIRAIEDQTQRQITLIEWQDATEFHRTNPSLLTMAEMIGMDTVRIDELWFQALTL